MKNRIKDTTTRSRVSRHNNKEPTVFQITGKPGLFLVESDDKRVAYKVRWNRHKGACSCDDYQQNHKGNGYLCKHITAVKDGQHKIALKAQTGSYRTEQEIFEILNRDFDKDKILYRADGFKTIETIHVINRLNEALGPLNWSFKHSTPTGNGKEYTCNGRIDVHINGKHTFRQQSGSCKYGNDNRVTLTRGEAQTGAIQMALKKCASLYGVALNQVYKANQQQ